MNWNTLIHETSRRAGVSPAEAAQILDSFFDTVIQHMETEDTVCLREDFGCFDMRAATMGRCPPFEVRGQKTPIFKSASELKHHLRQSDAAFLQRMWKSNAKRP